MSKKSERQPYPPPSPLTHKRRKSGVTSSQAGTPYFPPADAVDRSSPRTSLTQDSGAQSSLSGSVGSKMVAGTGEPYYQQQWQRDYGNHLDTAFERKNYAYLSPASYDESTHCGWEESHQSDNPTGPLLDRTFTRTIQLMASEDNDDAEHILSPQYQAARYHQAPKVYEPHRRSFYQAREEFHYSDMVQSPIRSRTSAFDEVTPRPAIAFTRNTTLSYPAQSSVGYGQLMYVVDALDEFTFVLPNLTRSIGNRFGHSSFPSEEDINIARRRLVSAVCFYGGNRPSASDAELARLHPIALRNRRTYEFLLSRRYRLHDDHISWSVEENPPAGRRLRRKSHESLQSNRLESNPSASSTEASVARATPGGAPEDNEALMALDDENEKEAAKEVKSTLSGHERKKAPYYCRLCGEPKQKHDCPFRRNLVRNIGTSVYPVVNAFQADEIGELAPRLLDMNNFVGGRYCAPAEVEQKEQKLVKEENENLEQDIEMSIDKQDTMQRENQLRIDSQDGTDDIGHDLAQMKMKSRSSSSKSELSAVQILPQQYKSLTLGLKASPVAYRYPSVPVFKKQRDRISNDLFSITESIPNLREECAAVLDDAERMNMWDQAAAELFAQVLTIIHCEIGDYRLEGLSKHLMDRGIAC